MTISKLSFLKRSPSLSADEFSSYWRVPHVRALVEEGGHREYNRSYVQNLILEHRLESTSSVFDGIAQMEIREDVPSTRRFQEDPRYMRSVRPDEEKFLDVGQCRVVYCTSEAVVDAPAGAHFKLFFMHAADPQMIRADLANLLQEIGGSARAGMTHHVVDHTKLTSMSDGSPARWPYTAITEIGVVASTTTSQLKWVSALHASISEMRSRPDALEFMTALERVIY